MQPTESKPKTAGELIAQYTGIVGSIVAILLTIWNAYTKGVLDSQQAKLQEFENRLKARSADLDESRERTDRYKWVMTLFPGLEDTDAQKRIFTVNMMRLALTEKEAETLFTGLQSSADKNLQSVGQSGISAIQNEPITRLVARLNDNKASVRISATDSLITNYKASSQAIELTLQLYDAGRINLLSPDGLINGLIFLTNTDPTAWQSQQIQKGSEIAKQVKAKATGPKTRQTADKFLAFLTTINR